MSRSVPEQPYRSAFDLPSFKEMENKLRAAKLLGAFLDRDAQDKLRRVDKEMQELGRSIDDFYRVLGPRNWVYHDILKPDQVADILESAKDAEDAERMFIALYTSGEWLDFWVRHASRRSDMLPWQSMITDALGEYRAENFQGAAMLLLAVMDGFVNNADTSSRRGLHARSPEEMKTWDRVSGHHMGLTRVMKTMFKPIKAPITTPVFELYRNGIMHGNVTNFNNVIVATKGWNYFFAVQDWADDLKKQATPEKKNPTWKELSQKLHETAENKRAIAAWSSTEIDPTSKGWTADELAVEATKFFRNWQAENFGEIALTMQKSHLDRHGKGAAAFSRKRFQRHPIDGFVINKISYTAAAVGVVSATVLAEGKSSETKVRWIRETQDGTLRPVGLPGGRWRRAFDSCPI